MWRFGVSFVESIDSKLISICLINDYSHIANLHTHMFVYGSAECVTISLECTKVKLLISNNFDFYEQCQTDLLLIEVKILEFTLYSNKWCNGMQIIIQT